MTLLLVFLGFSGLGISIWPHIIPPSINIWQAAAPPQSLGFMLVGALFIIPIILVYTFWSYYVFRGKISADEGITDGYSPKSGENYVDFRSKTVANPLWKRLLWLVAIWGGSVLALGCVSMLFRLLMTAAGLKSH